MMKKLKILFNWMLLSGIIFGNLPAQKAYIVPRENGRGPLELKFSLEFNKDPALRNPLSIYNISLNISDRHPQKSSKISIYS